MILKFLGKSLRNYCNDLFTILRDFLWFGHVSNLRALPYSFQEYVECSCLSILICLFDGISAEYREKVWPVAFLSLIIFLYLYWPL